MLRNVLSKKGIVLLVLFCGVICFGSIEIGIAGSVCEGDFDYDGDVDGTDLNVFAADFGRTDCPPSGPALVPKTGQTTSYAPGDDGDLEMGVAMPDPHFTDHEDGTVTDNLTGLMWTKDADIGPGQKIWSEALSDCNSCAAGGYNDWRLPNVRELHSLIYRSRHDPALPDGHPFSNVQANYYWSSTTHAYFSNSAWFVYFGSGVVYYYEKDNTYYVWCVRGGN